MGWPVGNTEAAGSTAEEGSGMTDFARGQKSALGVFVFAFVLFRSDNGRSSVFFFLSL